MEILKGILEGKICAITGWEIKKSISREVMNNQNAASKKYYQKDIQKSREYARRKKQEYKNANNNSNIPKDLSHRAVLE